MIWLKLGLIVAFIAAIVFAKKGYDEGLRSEGRTEVRAEWAAASKAAEKEAIKQAAESEAALKEKEVSRDKAFRELAARNDALSAQLKASRVDAVVISRLRDAVRTANSTSRRPATTPAGDPTPITRAPDVGGITGAETVVWFDSVAMLYAKCRTQVIGWNDFWDKTKEMACGR